MLDTPDPVGERRRVLARRIAALLFVVVFLLDVAADPLLVAAVSRLCAS